MSLVLAKAPQRLLICPEIVARTASHIQTFTARRLYLFLLLAQNLLVCPGEAPPGLGRLPNEGGILTLSLLPQGSVDILRLKVLAAGGF